MVTAGQMTGIVMAIVLPVLAGAIFYYLFWKKSSKVEAGIMGAIGYGVMGYIWEELIYSFLGLLALTKMTNILNATGGNAVVVAAVEALLSSAFVAVGLYWGMYLTNTKQRSMYRSATIGIGFGIGYSLLTYGFQLYYAIKINSGTFTGADSAKASILATSTTSLYLAAYRNVLMLLIFLGIALMMGKYYLEKKRLYAWLTPIVVYMFIRFTDVLLNAYLANTIAKPIVLTMLTIVAAGSVWLVIGFLRTGQVSIEKMEKNK